MNKQDFPEAEKKTQTEKMLILKASKEASFVEQLNTVEEVLVFFFRII